jgi:hypothetical protein
MSEEEIEDPKRRAERLRREIERHNRLYYDEAAQIQQKGKWLDIFVPVRPGLLADVLTPESFSISE